MKLMTSVHIPEISFDIHHQTSLFTIGSCFSNHIGHKLYTSGFNCEVEPFGTLFNPVSIAKTILMLKTPAESINEELFVESDGVWKHLYFSSKFASKDKKELHEIIHQTVSEKAEVYKNTDCILVTFGTAFTYQTKEGHTVASCHKQLQHLFDKRALNVEDIFRVWEPLILNSKDKDFIFTVSPVRHLKDGMVENTRSKAALHLAIQELVSEFNNCHYFPSFEIVMDELRDYRFYNADLIHPNEQAVDYIYEIFRQTFMSQETNKIIESFTKLVQFHNHRPLHESSKSFEKKKLQKVSEWNERHPHIRPKWIQDKYSRH